MFALVGDERITEKVSSVSTSVSPLTWTVMVLEISLLAKKSEPSVVMKSSGEVEPWLIDHSTELSFERSSPSLVTVNKKLVMVSWSPSSCSFGMSADIERIAAGVGPMPFSSSIELAIFNSLPSTDVPCKLIFWSAPV